MAGQQVAARPLASWPLEISGEKFNTRWRWLHKRAQSAGWRGKINKVLQLPPDAAALSLSPSPLAAPLLGRRAPSELRNRPSGARNWAAQAAAIGARRAAGHLVARLAFAWRRPYKQMACVARARRGRRAIALGTDCSQRPRRSCCSFSPTPPPPPASLSGRRAKLNNNQVKSGRVLSHSNLAVSSLARPRSPAVSNVLLIAPQAAYD